MTSTAQRLIEQLKNALLAALGDTPSRDRFARVRGALLAEARAS
jgi:hypothetical protein